MANGDDQCVCRAKTGIEQLFAVKPGCPDLRCPFKTWDQACRKLKRRLNVLARMSASLERRNQIWMFIFNVGKQYGMSSDKKTEWNTAVFSNRKNKKTLKDMRALRARIKSRLDSVCATFRNGPLQDVVAHTLNMKARCDGTRVHKALESSAAFAKIPAGFFYSKSGVEIIRVLGPIFHKKTFNKNKTGSMAKFLGADRKDASAGDLLDSTVYDSILQLMDNFMPALAADPSFKLKPRGFMDFLKGKKVATINLANLSITKLQQLPSRIVLAEQVMGPHGMSIKVHTLERADQLKCVALSGVLNTIGFFDALDTLSKDKSLYAKTKGIKATAELISSISKLSQLRKIQVLSKRAGVVGLALEAALSAHDSSTQFSLSSKWDDRRMLAASHLVKAAGASLMLVSLPVGALIYLLGAFGVLAFDSDPYVEWAKKTEFGTSTKGQFPNSRAALAELERKMKALGHLKDKRQRKVIIKKRDPDKPLPMIGRNM